MRLRNLGWVLNVRHQSTINMNIKSLHNNVNSILKKFDKVGRSQEVALKELSKLSKILKKGIN
jgi:hypothetical protein